MPPRTTRASGVGHSPPLTARELNRATLARQMLLARETLPAATAVARLAGLQAQLARPPFVGLWTRVAGFGRDRLLAALEGRDVVRVTAMRGTLHLLAAADYVALRGALQPALSRGARSILAGRGAEVDLEAMVAEGRELFGRGACTFDAVRKELARRHPGGDERAMAYAIRTHLPLVQLPATGAAWGFPAAADFALADEWLCTPVSTAPAPPDQLVRRYLAAFGPATPADAQAWSGLQGLRATFEALRSELVTFRDARGRELFDLPGAPRPPADTPAPVRFLPEFDNLVLSHDDRTRVLADEHRGRVVSKNLQVRATFLVDGLVAGTWAVERKRKAATLVLEPFAPLPKKTLAALEAEGDALVAFVEEDAPAREVRVA